MRAGQAATRAGTGRSSPRDAALRADLLEAIAFARTKDEVWEGVCSQNFYATLNQVRAALVFGAAPEADRREAGSDSAGLPSREEIAVTAHAAWVQQLEALWYAVADALLARLNPGPRLYKG
jgi:hypothetical protein